MFLCLLTTNKHTYTHTQKNVLILGNFSRIKLQVVFCHQYHRCGVPISQHLDVFLHQFICVSSSHVVSISKLSSHLTCCMTLLSKNEFVILWNLANTNSTQVKHTNRTTRVDEKWIQLCHWPKLAGWEGLSGPLVRIYCTQ